MRVYDSEIMQMVPKLPGQYKQTCILNSIKIMSNSMKSLDKKVCYVG